MGSLQCNMEFGYQLSICFGTKENHGKLSSIWPVAGLSRYKLTSSQQSGIKSASPNISPFLHCFCFLSFFKQVVFYNYCYVNVIWISTKTCITHVEGIKAYMNKYAYKYTYICI
jgi:hypothetical protein